MGKYKSLAKNSLFVFIGNIGSKAIGFLMLPFYTSWLSVEQYGTIDLVTVYVSLLLPFVSFSLTSAIFAVPVGASKKKQGEYFTIGLLFVSLFISITSILACLAVRICCLHEGVFSQYFVFICVMLYTSFLQTYLQQFCMAIDKMFIFSFTGIVLSGATAIFGFLLIPNGGIEGYLQSIIAANIVTIIVTAVVMKAHEYIRIKNLKISLLKEMLKYSTPMIPNALLWWI